MWKGAEPPNRTSITAGPHGITCWFTVDSPPTTKTPQQKPSNNQQHSTTTQSSSSDKQLPPACCKILMATNRHCNQVAICQLSLYYLCPNKIPFQQCCFSESKFKIFYGETKLLMRSCMLQIVYITRSFSSGKIYLSCLQDMLAVIWSENVQGW